jgi:HAD superfamily hydrolase (TIGR01459 family)
MKNLFHTHPIWFCDIWGVVHNGVEPFAPTVATLVEHRRAGGRVILVSNSPRSREGIITQLDQIGVTRDAYDDAVTSGDVTQDLMRKVPDGKVYHLGPERDLSLFKDVPVERVSLEYASAVVCSGLVHDDRETPEDYTYILQKMRARDLPMICANPDKIVRKGTRLLWCAGALADRYVGMGGAVSMAGKPYDPIYELAEQKASHLLGKTVARAQVLAIGDGPETDIKGAANRGYDCVYVSGGVRGHAEDMDAEVAEVKTHAPGVNIVLAVPHLTWS